MQSVGTEVGGELTGFDALGERLGAATTHLGARAAAAELAVQEHRKLEPVGEQVSEHERLGTGGSAVAVLQVHDRSHVDRSDTGMDALMAGEIDAADRLERAAEDGRSELPGPAGEHEHAAVVV